MFVAHLSPPFVLPIPTFLCELDFVEKFCIIFNRELFFDVFLPLLILKCCGRVQICIWEAILKEFSSLSYKNFLDCFKLKNYWKIHFNFELGSLISKGFSNFSFQIFELKFSKLNLYFRFRTCIFEFILEFQTY